MPKAGLTVAVAAGTGRERRMNQQRATEGKTEWGRRPSPAQPSCPGPRTQDQGPERCLLHPAGGTYLGTVQAGRQAKSNSGRQAGRQALQIRHA